MFSAFNLFVIPPSTSTLYTMLSVEQIHNMLYTGDMSKKILTASEMGKRGAAVANSRRTPEQRKKAAKKGWITRRKNKKH